MPAYRSAAEAEIRDAVVERLRLLRPGARIIHEINAFGFGNRIDVLAVDRAEIIAVEVKSEKDKIDRLPKQIEAMRGVAHHVIAALHEKFLVPSKWETKTPCVVAPKEARGATVWAFPEAGADAGRTFGCARWEEPKPAIQAALPWTAIDILWRDELFVACRDLGVSVPIRATMPFMKRALIWNVSGGDLTKAICGALRRRECVEADPPMTPTPQGGQPVNSGDRG